MAASKWSTCLTPRMVRSFLRCYRDHVSRWLSVAVATRFEDRQILPVRVQIVKEPKPEVHSHCKLWVISTHALISGGAEAMMRMTTCWRRPWTTAGTRKRSPGMTSSRKWHRSLSTSGSKTHVGLNSSMSGSSSRLAHRVKPTSNQNISAGRASRRAASHALLWLG